MKSEKWLRIFSIALAFLLLVLLLLVLILDPYLHFHKPLTDTFYYCLDNERYVGNGILRNMDYDALITGTSMAQNFNKTDADRFFGTDSVKVTFAAASYYEINNNIASALEYNPGLKTVIRCLDYAVIIDDADRMVLTGNDYPDYLYDDNVFNDVKYVYNTDVIFGKVYRMFKEKLLFSSFSPGITDFDSYANWMDEESFVFGPNELCSDLSGDLNVRGEPQLLSDGERQKVIENVRNNITELADRYPDTEFYYFFSPYSAVWWQMMNSQGLTEKYIEAEEIAIEEILLHENIKLYSFNTVSDITLDLNNYKDSVHYGEWVNTLILKWMSEDVGRLTEDNYKAYLDEELEMYSSFDYNSLRSQPDWEDPYTAAELLNEKYAFK